MLPRKSTGLMLPLPLFFLWIIPGSTQPPQPPNTALSFEISLAPHLGAKSVLGRVLVVLSKDLKVEPRDSIGQTGMAAPVVLGADAKGFNSDSSILLDQNSGLFPLAHLSKLQIGKYAVQAVLAHNPDLNLPDAPGNLFSAATVAELDPAKGGLVKLVLAKAVPAEKMPDDSAEVKYIKLRSELLSRFHGRDMFLRAGLILPHGFDKEPQRRYPLRVHIGGYGTRFTSVKEWFAKEDWKKLWQAPDTPRMLFLHLDGAGPYGDPYQVNSANHGPFGDAVTRELIPFVEKTYRGIGAGHARVLDGGSTGGWVSLALQIFYPDFFNGAWSHCPDPVDFRAFELIDIYGDDNAYVNRFGFERPSTRTSTGDVQTTVRHECQMERTLGRGSRWELSGKDWCAWNATFGPHGVDGLPKPLWNGVNGKIDRTVLDHWKQYDLRLHLEKNWPALAPKLRGKIRIWVGEADEFYLNNAVHLLDNFFAKAQPAFEGKITFGPRQGHSWRGLTEKEMMADMAKVMKVQ